MILSPDTHLEQLLPSTRATVAELVLHVVDSQDSEGEAVSLVADGELERRVDVSLLLVTTDVQQLLARTVVCETVYKPGVGVESEDDGPVIGEERGVLGVRQAMRVVAVGDQLEEIHDVDEAHFHFGEVLAEQGSCGEGFLGHDVSAGGDDDVGLFAVVVGGPVPDADTLGAVRDGGVHVEELDVVLLVGDDDVDVIGRAEAMVHCAEQAVCVGWEVDADDFGRLVNDDGEEAGVLVGETVVICIEMLALIGVERYRRAYLDATLCW
jgi:hypothetical protein